MENEVKEVTYLAVAAMVLSLVLSFAVYVINVNNGIADIRNGQIQANQQLKQYNLYNKYDRNTLIGDEVVECIRLYYDTGVSIFVDSRTNNTITPAVKIDATHNKNAVNSTGQTVTCNAPDCTDHRVFNLHQYIHHNGDQTSDGPNYFEVRTGLGTSNKKALDDLRNWFPTESRYRAYLVYNNKDVIEFYDELMDSYRRSGASGTIDTKLNKLDSLVYNAYPGSEVSGIVFINLDTIT